MTSFPFIRKGHGYEVTETLNTHLQRCTAFDDLKIIASPLPGNDKAGRESRVYRAPGAQWGTDYGSHRLWLATNMRDKGLYVLVQHGSGREVLVLHTIEDGGAMRDSILAMPERVQYALLYAMYSTASDARRAAETGTATDWAQAFADGRLKKRRKAGSVRVEITRKEKEAV